MNLVQRVKSKLISKVKFKVDPNSTHSEFLVASIEFLIANTPIETNIVMIEVGTGGTSSRVMRTYLERHQNTHLVSLENDLVWFEKYKAMYVDHNRHRILFVEEGSWERDLEKICDAIPDNSLIISFIDSSPWESRVSALHVLRERSSIFLIHDIDYFPHNGILGLEIKPIKNRPRNPFLYGNLKRKNLGLRNYENVAKYWIEVFPEVPGYFTGPPTLIASEITDVSAIKLPKGCIIQSFSPNLKFL